MLSIEILSHFEKVTNISLPTYMKSPTIETRGMMIQDSI